MQIIKADSSKGQSFNVFGLPVDSIFTRPQMNAGRWLMKGDANAIAVSSALMGKLEGVAVGDTVTLSVGNKKRDWKIIGVFPDPYDLLAYAEFGYLSRSLGKDGLASQVYIAKDPAANISQDELAARIEKSFKDSGIKVVATMTKDTIASSWSGRDAFTINFLMSMAAMAAVIGGLGLMGLMSLNVLERTREIGVMRSIGAASASVGSIVMTEGLIIGALAWLFAIPASIPISLAFNTAMGNLMVGKPLAFIFSPSGLYLWGGTVVIIAIAASLLPAYRAMKMSIRETLAYE
jgi:putative ABC transport system permease protein